MAMKPLALVFALALGAAPVLGAPAEPPLQELATIEVAPGPGGVTLAGVERFLNGIRTLSAAFVQTAPDGTVSRGRLYLERPGKARFEYSDGTPVLIVADGTILNFIDYDVGQITRWPIKDTALAPLVSDAVRFGGNVEIASLGPGGVAGLTAVTAFDPAKPEQGTLTLILSGSEASGMTLLAWEVVDAQGALTRIQLENDTLNAPLEERLWTYEDPRGERFQRKRTR